MMIWDGQWYDSLYNNICVKPYANEHTVKKIAYDIF